MVIWHESDRIQTDYLMLYLTNVSKISLHSWNQVFSKSLLSVIWSRVHPISTPILNCSDACQQFQSWMWVWRIFLVLKQIMFVYVILLNYQVYWSHQSDPMDIGNCMYTLNKLNKTIYWIVNPIKPMNTTTFQLKTLTWISQLIWMSLILTLIVFLINQINLKLLFNKFMKQLSCDPISWNEKNSQSNLLTWVGIDHLPEHICAPGLYVTYWR